MCCNFFLSSLYNNLGSTTVREEENFTNKKNVKATTSNMIELLQYVIISPEIQSYKGIMTQIMIRHWQYISSPTAKTPARNKENIEVSPWYHKSRLAHQTIN